MTPLSPRHLGIIAALATLLLDQATKLWVLFIFELPARGRVEIMPFIDFVMVWNRGISYGLFQQESDTGRWLLVAVTVAAVLLMGFWLKRETQRATALGLGLVIGGAIGNGIDRIAYGAVADFVLFYTEGFEWYVFNIADAAIVAGAGLLLYGALTGSGAGENKDTGQAS